MEERVEIRGDEKVKTKVSVCIFVKFYTSYLHGVFVNSNITCQKFRRKSFDTKIPFQSYKKKI